MPATPSEPEVGVVGAGAVGLCTAYALLERGVGVRVHEPGRPGHAQSGGDSRILRHAHDDPRLVEETVRSRAVLEDWEDRLGVELVSRDGAVALGPAVERRLPLLEQAGVPVRRLDAAGLAEHLPLLDVAGLGEVPAMIDERGGSIRTRALVDAICDVLGQRLVTDEVLAVRSLGGPDDGVEVRTGGATHRYRRVVLCAGRGTGALARPLGLSLPVALRAHARLTFAVRGTPPARVATLQDGTGTFGEPAVYGAPLPGNARFALGVAEDVEARDDGSLPDPDALARLAERAARYVRRALPGLDPDPVGVRHCWATPLPWGEDALAVWEAGGVLVPAGHNLFKQAPSLGRRLAAALAGEPLAALLRPASRLGSPVTA